MNPLTIAAIAAGACCLLAFDAFCLTSLVRHQASDLPKWTWALIICASFPLGGLAYLAFGKRNESLESPEPPDWRWSVFYLPFILLSLPSPWNHRIEQFTLPFAAYQVVALHPAANLLTPALSLLVLIAWPAIALAAAGVLITRRGA